MNGIKLFAVEYCYGDGRSTYNIFKNLKQAVSFYNDLTENQNDIEPCFIFSAIFNQNFIYKENGHLNYEDCLELIIEYGEILQVFEYNKQKG